MEIIKTEGIVIGETNYSESSKILKVLTKDYGIISIMSKGCRSLKSKFRGLSNKLVYANFYINYKEDGISILRDGDIIDTLRNIIFDIEKVTYLSYLIDLTEQVYKQSKSNKIYQVLVSVIKKINEGFDITILSYIYELKLLDFLGIRPNVDSCCCCGDTKSILTISVPEGGFICKNCYKNSYLYSDKAIKLIRMFIYLDIDNITKISLKEETKKELELFIEDYYETYSGIYLKNKNFFNNLNKIVNK